MQKIVKIAGNGKNLPRKSGDLGGTLTLPWSRHNQSPYDHDDGSTLAGR